MMRKFEGDKLVFASHNAGKIAELRHMIGAYVPNILVSKEMGLPEPDETGTTFHENAAIKAREIARLTKIPALADDSGLCIDALDGSPGVYSADWAGHPRNFKAAMHRVLELMRGVDNRHAYFTTVLALAWPDGHVEYAQGRIEGTITRAPRGGGGFGYDPIFMPDGFAKTFGEMDSDLKKSMSHRTRALQGMADRCFSAR